ncbi:hypothetical protein PsYK624_057010 [Phanerochaete sordida]|uniref:F-box domain-containing protein n=1 Tax=Phanerochaete sordida TaxID=48140 RepID=A0A9P3G7P9_9APHY|nr:hypothetical protein PsYK624_057010 [Phanerochaete sordida]
MDLVRRLITTSGSFLPNLQNLNIVMKYSNAESVYAAVDLLLSPSIRSLAFHTGSSGPGDHHELLERAGRICPHITYLNAAASLSHPFALSSFSRLEDFVSHDALPAEALAHLASLDTVHALDIAPPNPQASSLLLHRGSFAFLRTLFMCCSPFLNDRPFIAPFLRAISSQTLQSVSIFTRIHSSHDNDLTYLSELISAISNFASLRYFQLTAGCKTWGGDCDLLPLQRLRRLKSLSLSLDRIVPNFTDSSLPQYGAAWPEIEDLRVVYITERLSDLERRTTLTLAALSAFAQHFPRLESFRGHLDARAIDTSVDLQHLPSTLRLVNLDIRNSLAGEDTKAIAAYISAVCPFGYLTSIHDSYVPEAELDREHEKAWSAVEQIVNHVAGARR